MKHLSDSDGITEISLEGIQALKNVGEKLDKIIINSKSVETVEMFIKFYFESGSTYTATGFAVGYGGEGPRGFHKAIRMFNDKISDNFWNTPISTLSTNHNWKFSADTGRFEVVVSLSENITN